MLCYDENRQDNQLIISNNDDDYHPDNESNVVHTQYEVHHSNDERSNMSLTISMLSIKEDASINILTATNATTGSWTSREHACYLCFNLYANVARHIEHLQADVEYATKAWIWSGLGTLIIEGNYVHNYEIIEQKDYTKLQIEKGIHWMYFRPC